MTKIGLVLSERAEFNSRGNNWLLYMKCDKFYERDTLKEPGAATPGRVWERWMEAVTSGLSEGP